jgi:hypothetical protein
VKFIAKDQARFCGHLQKPSLNFEVTYPSGIILTEASSIVETTDKEAEKVGPSANTR